MRTNASGSGSFTVKSLIAASSCFFAIACGDDVQDRIVERWSYEAASALAPPGVGADDRIVVISREAAGAGGELVTLERTDGRTIEGPFPQIALSEHAPVMIGAEIFLVTKIGRLVKLNLAGQTLFDNTISSQPTLTTPLTAAPDGSLRLASNIGEVVGLRADGSEMFRYDLGSVPTSALAVDASGTTYVASDSGRLTGIDTSGGVVLSVDNLDPPASGPSVSGAMVVVGDANSVRGFDASSGAELFRHERKALVVGTAFTSDGEILAWGEDGIVDLLDNAGIPIFSFSPSSAAPIYIPPVELDDGRFGVIDSEGVAHLVERDGSSSVNLSIGSEPLKEIANAGGGVVVFTTGTSVRAIDFTVQ